MGICREDPPPIRPDLDRDPNDPFGPLEVCIGPSCSRSRGEPHIETFDGRGYQMQAVGEFVLVRTDGLEVQQRTVEIGDTRQVSFGSAAAVAIAEELRRREVRGTDVYIFNTFLCLSAVHAGVVGMDSGGV